VHPAPENRPGRDGFEHREPQDLIDVARALQRGCPHLFGQQAEIIDECRRRQIALIRGETLEATTAIQP
jgi:hypothetical protein